MRASLYLATSAFVLVSAVTALGDIAWRPDLQTAHREALSSGKLLLVHFYGDNCAWCDKLEEGAFKDRRSSTQSIAISSPSKSTAHAMPRSPNTSV